MASLVSLPILFFSTRRYLRYATPGYRRERISYATMSGSVAETAEGARTVDAHRLGARQAARIEENVRESFYSEMYTLLLRMVWFPTVEGAFALAVAATLAWSGWLAINGHVTIGAATTVTLYVVQINDPAGPHRLVARRAPDRPDVARAPRGRLGRARRPPPDRARAHERDPHARERALRLPQRPRRAERRVAHRASR